MIEDDADPETLDAWYRRSPEDIEAERAARWNAAWQALRLPEHLAREPDVIAGGTGDDVLMGDAGKDHVKRKGPYVSPTVTTLDPYMYALIDTVGSHEATDYDVLYSPDPRNPRRIKRGPDGAPDYSRHPNDGALIASGPNKGKTSTAAGRYQFNKPTWDERVGLHPDLKDFTPPMQDLGAWYLAADTYGGRTGRDLAQDLRDPSRYPAIAAALKDRWTSLPGGIEQGQGQAEFNRRMEENLRLRSPR